MKPLLCTLLLAVIVAGCDWQQSLSTDEHWMADGAVSVRLRDAGQNAGPAPPGQQFVIAVQQPGWLRFGLGSDHGFFSVPVHDAPAVLDLQVELQQMTASRVLGQFIAPLYGAEAASLLRDQDPGAQLVLSTFVIKGRDGMGIRRLTAGPFPIRVPSSGMLSSFSTLQSLQESEDTGTLATWVFVPTVGSRRTGVGAGAGEVQIYIDDELVTAEEVGAVIHELTIGFSPEQPELAQRGVRR